MNRSRPDRFSPLRRLLSFPPLRPGRKRDEAFPSEGELLFELAGHNPDNLLFGRFGPEEIRERVRAAGIRDGLARRGYREPLLALECGDPQDQRICLYAGNRSRDRLLMEVRLQIRAFRPGKPVGPFLEENVFRMLLIHWLLLSDPDRPFSIDRPRLPGEERLGLGLLPECLSLLFYSREFRFLEPEAEGRFQEIARALEGIPLALASEAVQEGCPIDRANGLPILWEPAEQGMPLCDPLRLHLRSPGYRLACAEAGSGLAPGVDWDR